jgi:HEAT repeat protein
LFAVDPDGAQAAASLIAALKDPPGGSWDTAVEICLSRGAKVKAVVPTLLAVFRESKGIRQSTALETLFEVDPTDAGVQAALLAALKDTPDPKKDAPTPREWREKRGALRSAIGICQAQGPKAKAAVPTLVELHANTSDEDLRRAVLRAIQKIDPAVAKKLGGG